MWVLVLYCTVICLLGFPTTAHAYLDPGTGSALLQGLAAAFLVAGMYMRRVRTFVSKHVLTWRLDRKKR
jgi:hypothetical protein